MAGELSTSLSASAPPVVGASRGRSRLAALAGACLRPPFVLCAPAAAFLAAFFVAPLLLVVWMSFTEPSQGLENYRAFFSSAYDLKVLGLTFRTALVVTLTTLVLAYPIAYVAARAGGRLGAALLAVVALSFWTSYLVRTYAWMVILGTRGPVAATLAALGWTPAPKLLFTTPAATFAMAHMLVPFMVLALYAVMKRIDEVHMRAALGLGASPLKAFLAVYLPLSAPGIVNGVTLVFITCLGFYVTPALIGSPQDKMIAGRIGQQIEQLLDFGAASATAMVLLAATLALFSIYNRFVGIEKLWR